MTDSNKSISLLRQRMTEDMTMRKLNPKTQSGYIRASGLVQWPTVAIGILLE